MWYRAFQFFFWILNTAFYRRVYYLGKEHIPPRGTAAILASNHSNGLMDPVLMSDYQPRPVYFWVAASEIPGNIVGTAMRTLHSIPIYRAKEGNMHRNKETFEITKKHLHTGWDAMFIAPEGRCKVQKHLLPLKKGCVRLAFEVLEENQWKKPVTIVPTGLNYTDHTRFRSTVYVAFGTPIVVNDYQAAYQENKENAIIAVTMALRAGIQDQMIYVEPEDEALTERLLPLLRNSWQRGALPFLSKDPQYFRSEQALAQQVGRATADEKAAWEAAVQRYEAALAVHGVTDTGVADANRRSILWIVLGAPIGILGMLAGRIPHTIARRLRNKFVPFPEFSVSFAMVMGFVIWLLWSLLVTGIGAIWLGWWTLLLPVVLVGAQLYAYHYQDYYHEWQARGPFQRLPKTVQEELQTLRGQITPLNGIK